VRLFRPKYKDRKGCVRTSRIYRVRWSINGVRGEASTGARDRHAAAAIAAKLVRQAELKAAGIETFADVREKPLKELTVEYQREIERRGRTKRHGSQTKAQLDVLFEDLPDLRGCTVEKLRQRLAKLAAKTTRMGRAPSARWQNAIRVAGNGFFRWLQREGRWHENPIQGTSPVKEIEPAVKRRALDEAELRNLLAAAPIDRRIAYALAAMAGLRRSEAQALTWADIDLEERTLRVRAAAAKSKREALVPIHADLAAALAAWRESRPAADGDHVLPERVPSTKILRKDLAAAGIPATDPDGVKVDFHAARTTFATRLSRSGVSPTMAQKLTRLATLAVLAKHYVKLELADVDRAVAKLPTLGIAQLPPEPSRSAAPSGSEDCVAEAARSEFPRPSPTPSPSTPISTTEGASTCTDEGTQNEPRENGQKPRRTRSFGKRRDLVRVVGAEGIEPPTDGLKVRCSAD